MQLRFFFWFPNDRVIACFWVGEGGSRSIEDYAQNTYPKLFHSCSAVSCHWTAKGLEVTDVDSENKGLFIICYFLVPFSEGECLNTE